MRRQWGWRCPAVTDCRYRRWPFKNGAWISQTPDAEKRRRAHFIIDTGHGIEAARRRVDDILKAVAAMQTTDNRS